MDPEFHRFESIESRLGELADAEAAGVFGPTVLDAHTLVNAGSRDRARVLLTPRRWMSIAAALAMAVTVWGWMFAHQVNKIRERQLDGTPFVAATDGVFFASLSGPNSAPTRGADSHDYDGDGDLDLADFRTFQLRFAATSQ